MTGLLDACARAVDGVLDAVSRVVSTLLGRGEISDAPPPDCDCADCLDEADFADWTREIGADV